MTDALQKLAALDKAAEWEREGFPALAAMVARNDLYALSHLLLPTFEALETLTMLDMEGGEDMLRAVGGGMAVLAQLEEALK